MMPLAAVQCRGRTWIAQPVARSSPPDLLVRAPAEDLPALFDGRPVIVAESRLPDTVALQKSAGVRELPGLKGTVKFHWNGSSVESPGTALAGERGSGSGSGSPSITRSMRSTPAEMPP